MEHCHDAPMPDDESQDDGHGCCGPGTVSGCMMLNGACCSISEQTLPTKVKVELPTSRIDVQPAASSFKPPGPLLIRQSFKSPPFESIDRLSLHSILLI